MSARWSKTGEFEVLKEGESLYSGLAGGPGSTRDSAYEPPGLGKTRGMKERHEESMLQGIKTGPCQALYACRFVELRSCNCLVCQHTIVTTTIDQQMQLVFCLNCSAMLNLDVVES
jgi:hypothetical protein